MSRLMNGLGDENGTSSQGWVPAVDVWETENDVVYAFDLPGIPEDKISVEVENGSLTVSAERTRTNELSNDRFYRFERRHGTFTRTIGLPQGVSEDAIKADYSNGVLEIHVPKPEQAKPKRIEIGGTGSQGTIEGDATQK
jgi:HSP20 family protein